MNQSPKILLTLAAGPLPHERELAKSVEAEIEKLIAPIKRYVLLGGTIDDHRKAREEAERLRGVVLGAILLVLTGGTDRIIYDFVETMGSPVMVFAHMRFNALASLREAIAALRREGHDALVSVGDIDEMVDRVKPFISALLARNAVSRARIGLVGRPEPWILMKVDPSLARSRLGIELVEVRWSDLLKNALAAPADKVEEEMRRVKELFGNVEVDDDDLEKAIRIYISLEEIVRRHKLKAVAVEARDMLDPRLRDWGPYLAVSLLSATGIEADYELDAEAIITKLIVRELTGRSSFMANVTHIDEEKGRAIFSHCTIPIDMIDTSRSSLTSYFETGRSVAIRGYVEAGMEVTFARIGGHRLDKLMIGYGTVSNGYVGRPDLCRTQIEVEVEGDVSRLISDPLGNHTVLVFGDARRELEYIARFMDLETILV